MLHTVKTENREWILFVLYVCAGNGLPHNKKFSHLHFLYTKIHINRKTKQNNINSGCHPLKRTIKLPHNFLFLWYVKMQSLVSPAKKGGHCLQKEVEIEAVHSVVTMVTGHIHHTIIFFHLGLNTRQNFFTLSNITGFSPPGLAPLYCLVLSNTTGFSPGLFRAVLHHSTV